MACSVTLGVNRSETSCKCPTIDVCITDTVFTPLACASLVNEIIKSLVYQKSQIPYPYNWLKMVVEKKRKKGEQDNLKTNNFTIDRHYRLASTAYDNLEAIMSNIRKEFENYTQIQEVLILFGTTPQCPKEAFTIKIPDVATNHIEENHIRHLNKNQHQILRNIFLSDIWLTAVTTVVTYTNMYVMLKKKHTICNSKNEHFFIPTRCNIPLRVRNTVINLNYTVENDDSNCCRNLTVFEDEVTQQEQQLTGANSGGSEDNCEDTNDGQWYQAKVLLTGFKDCFINKISASELW